MQHPYCHLYMEDITDADYALLKRVSKDFEINFFGEYHSLYVQSKKLFLTDVFENFWNMSFEIYELDPTRFLTARELPWQTTLKKSKKLDLFNNSKMLLMIEKRCQKRMLFIDMLKLRINTWTIKMKITNRDILSIGI